MTVIEARGLRKTFSIAKKVGRVRRKRVDVHAVDGIDLTVETGDMLGYIGPNGAGKSTTLKMFTGVLTPPAGTYECVACGRCRTGCGWPAGSAWCSGSAASSGGTCRCGSLSRCYGTSTGCRRPSTPSG
nr:ATP-binding cassette domain-containing protein [Fodinicola feengrottensis]